MTAFDHLEAAAPPAPGTCDALVFPAGIRFSGLALDAAPAAVLAALTGDSAAVAAAGGRELQGSSLLVCCHTARDARCGHVGPPLAARLAELLGQQGGAGATCTVYKSSHVGGHKVLLGRAQHLWGALTKLVLCARCCCQRGTAPGLQPHGPLLRLTACFPAPTPSPTACAVRRQCARLRAAAVLR